MYLVRLVVVDLPVFINVMVLVVHPKVTVVPWVEIGFISHMRKQGRVIKGKRMAGHMGDVTLCSEKS